MENSEKAAEVSAQGRCGVLASLGRTRLVSSEDSRSIAGHFDPDKNPSSAFLCLSFLLPVQSSFEGTDRNHRRDYRGEHGLLRPVHLGGGSLSVSS